MSTKLRTLLRFISLLRLEPFMLMFTTFYFIKRNSLDVLIQDKLCRNKYNMTEEFCINLYSNDSDICATKTLVLAEAVMYNAYNQWISFPLSIVWSLFLGTWCDRYPKGRKCILIIAAITQTMEAAINTMNSYFFTLS